MTDHRCDMDQTSKYLQGKMQAEEKEAFEQLLNTDALFREEFEFNRDLLESMRIHYRSRLKGRLQDLEQAAVPTAFRQRRVYYWVSGMAAAVLLVIVTSYWFFFLRTNPQLVFDQYYTPYYNVLEGTERSMSGNQGELAMRLYDQKRYEDAIPVFEQAIARQPNAPFLLFYKGLSHLSIKQADSAIVNLEKVRSRADFRLIEPAQWYLGLAYLQKGEIETAESVFEEIANSQGSYSDRASDILKAIH